MMDLINKISTQAVCIDEFRNAWVFANDFNGLFKFNLDNKKIEFIKTFEDEDVFAREMYTCALLYNNKITYIPCCAKSIAIFDINTKQVRYIPIRDEEYIVYFNSVRINEKKVLLYPVVYSEKAYVFDMEQEVYEVINLKYGEKNAEFSDYINKPLVCGNAFINNRAYFVIYGTDTYIALDVISHKIIFYKCNYSKEGLFYVRNIDERLIFMTEHGKQIICYDSNHLDTKKIAVINLPSIEQKKAFAGELMAYSQYAILKNNNILFMPVRGGSLYLKTDEKDYIISVNWNEIGDDVEERQAFADVKEVEGKVYLFPYYSDCILILDLLTNEIEYIKSKIEINESNFICKEIINKSTFANREIYEQRITLEHLLNFLISGE